MNHGHPTCTLEATVGEEGIMVVVASANKRFALMDGWIDGWVDGWVNG